MKYLIAGTGGVGGSIAGFLSLAGKDVTCIARGAHLQAIQTNGLKLKVMPFFFAVSASVPTVQTKDFSSSQVAL